MESNRRQYDTISFGLFLLFVGTVALLSNIGLISWSLLLDFVLQYWPVFIIMAGIKMVGNSQFGRFFGLVVDVLFFVGVILGLIFLKDTLLNNSFTNQTENKMTESMSFSLPLTHFPDAKSVKYDFSFGAAEFNIGDEIGENYLSMSGPKGSELNYAMNTSNEVHVEAKNAPFDKFYRFPNRNDLQKLDLIIGNALLDSSIELSSGASKGTITLDSVKLNSLVTKVGAGELTIDLTNSAVAKNINISVGAGKTTLRINGSHTVKVTYALGAGNFKLKSLSQNLDKDFGGIGANGVYETSPNAEVEITVSIGAGEVEVVLD